ncbi:MAG: TlpA family protein disulfide reductase [Flavobacteriales bacterium]|jgi:thiol-disulfide isomerase/thioredoxin
MKNLLLLLVTISILSCQKKVKPTHVIFTGSIENSNSNSAKISGNGFEKVIEITENGSFSDTLKIDKEGYYSLRIGRESTPVYLIQGANVGLTLNTKEFDESLVYTGDIAAENNYLAAKYLLSEKEMAFDKVYSLPEDEFIIELNKINSSYSDLLNSSTEVTKGFIKNETKELEYAHINNIENYEEYYQYLTKDTSFKASESLYNSYKEFNFADTDAFENSSAYKTLLTSYYARIAKDAFSNSDKDIALAYLETVDHKFPNGAIKDELMFNYLRYGMKANNNLEDVYNLYKASNQNTENLSEVTNSYKTLSNLRPGKASPSFDYENFKGGKTSLEDLKGKVVYVDVWATWCGPCLREIPALKILEADYHNKNIAFVSLSIDEKKDYNKWRTMITEKNLDGIQLMADNDWKSKFVIDYGIKGIPRFIIIDTKGNIVNSDAPRPSNPDIRKAFDELL